jgi:hypothetical protein
LSLHGVASPSLLIQGGVGLNRLEVTQEHLQNLMSWEYMTASELATCCVSENPVSPALIGGYVVSCTVFYEQVFGVPLH